MTIESILEQAAHESETWDEYARAVGMGANQIVPAIREMQARGCSAAHCATVLKHLAAELNPPKRKAKK